MSSTTASRIFAAQDENVPAITAFITEQAELAGVSPKRILQLELVIEEVVVNICHYAYEVPPGEVVIRTYCEEDKFGIEFEDSGIPFDVLFGPAYKGIPLAATTAVALAEHHDRDIDRKSVV